MKAHKYKDLIERSFTYHAPPSGGVENIKNLRAEAKYLAHCIASVCPQSRETAKALGYLEQAIMWANAAIVRYPIDDSSSTEA